VLAADAGGADTVSEVQALVTTVTDALAKIEAYNVSDGDGSAPDPTVEDYVDAGVTGVTAGNVYAANAKVLAADTGGADTTLEVQALVDAPIAKINLNGEGDFIGQLIKPVEVLINGVVRTYYYWDRDGSGDLGGVDFTTHATLDSLFNNGADTTSADGTRLYTMADGTILRLPTVGRHGSNQDVDDNDVVSSPTENQTTYTDYAAIKDAFDGSGTGSGTPEGWSGTSNGYWSATTQDGRANEHGAYNLNTGTWSLKSDAFNSYYVALEVVTVADQALAKIEAYNVSDGDGSASVPTVGDYSNAGVTGVTTDNLAAVNAQVSAAATGGANSAVEIQNLVTTVTDALAKIEAYNNGDDTSPAALDVADYAAAGITGVTADNLAAVNAQVLAAATGDADTVSEVQGLVVAAVAALALAKIEDYNNGDGASPAALAVQDYVDAGITGVTTDNLDVVNAQVLAADAGGADTVSEVQALVTTVTDALAKIEAYNVSDGDGSAPLPTVDDYVDAGITGVTQSNLDAANAKVLAADTGGADTSLEVQALVDGPIAKINLNGEGDFIGQLIKPVEVLINGVVRTYYYWDRNGNGEGDYGNALVGDTATHDQLDSLFNNNADTTDSARSYTMSDGTILRLPTLGIAVGRDVDLDENVASPTDNQTELDDLAAIKDAFDGTGDGLGLPTGWGADAVYHSATSTIAGQHWVMSFGAGNSSSQGDGLTTYVALEVVTVADQALAKIEAYNVSDGDGSASVPTVGDYSNAGVTGVTTDNLAAVNAQVSAAATGGADTVSEVQALVTAADALAEIAEDVAGNANGTPVTAAQIGLVAKNVDAALEAQYQTALADGSNYADPTSPTAAEVQAVVNAVNPPPAATIDLSGEAGFGGQLINPVEVLINGVERTFYFWDRSGNGVAGSGDLVNHNVLDTLFNGGADTTDAIDDRSYTMADGTILRLPTNGTEVGREVYRDEIVASPTENQTVLDDFAAINDAFNGVSSGTLKSGTPDGWEASNYWTATSTGAGYHVAHGLHVGTSNASLDGNVAWLALEVV